MPDKKEGPSPVTVQIRHYRLKELRECRSTTDAITYIETFRELTKSEKADIYEDYIKQTKGHAPKSNPWAN